LKVDDTKFKIPCHYLDYCLRSDILGDCRKSPKTAILTILHVMKSNGYNRCIRRAIFCSIRWKMSKFFIRQFL